MSARDRHTDPHADELGAWRGDEDEDASDYALLLVRGVASGSGAPPHVVEDAVLLARWREEIAADWLAALRERATIDGLAVDGSVVEAAWGITPLAWLASPSGEAYGSFDPAGPPRLEPAALARLEADWGATLAAARERLGLGAIRTRLDPDEELDADRDYERLLRLGACRCFDRTFSLGHSAGVLTRWRLDLVAPWADAIRARAAADGLPVSCGITSNHLDGYAAVAQLTRPDGGFYVEPPTLLRDMATDAGPRALADWGEALAAARARSDARASRRPPAPTLDTSWLPPGSWQPSPRSKEELKLDSDYGRLLHTGFCRHFLPGLWPELDPDLWLAGIGARAGRDNLPIESRRTSERDVPPWTIVAMLLDREGRPYHSYEAAMLRPSEPLAPEALARLEHEYGPTLAAARARCADWWLDEALLWLRLVRCVGFPSGVDEHRWVSARLQTGIEEVVDAPAAEEDRVPTAHLRFVARRCRSQPRLRAMGLAWASIATDAETRTQAAGDAVGKAERPQGVAHALCELDRGRRRSRRQADANVGRAQQAERRRGGEGGDRLDERAERPVGAIVPVAGVDPAEAVDVGDDHRQRRLRAGGRLRGGEAGEELLFRQASDRGLRSVVCARRNRRLIHGLSVVCVRPRARLPRVSLSAVRLGPGRLDLVAAPVEVHGVVQRVPVGANEPQFMRGHGLSQRAFAAERLADVHTGQVEADVLPHVVRLPDRVFHRGVPALGTDLVWVRTEEAWNIAVQPAAESVDELLPAGDPGSVQILDHRQAEREVILVEAPCGDHCLPRQDHAPQQQSEKYGLEWGSGERLLGERGRERDPEPAVNYLGLKAEARSRHPWWRTSLPTLVRS